MLQSCLYILCLFHVCHNNYLTDNKSSPPCNLIMLFTNKSRQILLIFPSPQPHSLRTLTSPRGWPWFAITLAIFMHHTPFHHLSAWPVRKQISQDVAQTSIDWCSHILLCQTSESTKVCLLPLISSGNSSFLWRLVTSSPINTFFKLLLHYIVIAHLGKLLVSKGRVILSVVPINTIA